MARAFANGATLLAFGNGGSTTDAQDLVTELINPPFPAWSPLPAIALTNDIAVITGVGNDVGIDNIYARQVIAFRSSRRYCTRYLNEWKFDQCIVSTRTSKETEIVDRCAGRIRWWQNDTIFSSGLLYSLSKRSHSTYPGGTGDSIPCTYRGDI